MGTVTVQIYTYIVNPYEAYIFRPSHEKCQDKTEAAGTADYNFPDFLTKQLVDLFIIHSQINPPFATICILNLFQLLYKVQFTSFTDFSCL